MLNEVRIFERFFLLRTWLKFHQLETWFRQGDS